MCMDIQKVFWREKKKKKSTQEISSIIYGECLDLEGLPAQRHDHAEISSPSLGGVCSVYVLEACVALCTEKKDGLCCFKFTILIKLTLSPVEYLCTLSNAIYFM